MESLETPRLQLRRPVAADRDAIFERYGSRERVTRYLGFPRHRTPADTEAFLAFSDEHWATWPAGPYLIFAKQTGSLLGSTGLRYEAQDRVLTGYILAEDAWGQGYATEALGAMVELGVRLGLPALSALCHPDHRVSQHVLEKCGFARVGAITLAGMFPNLEQDPGDALEYARSLLSLPRSETPNRPGPARDR